MNMDVVIVAWNALPYCVHTVMHLVCFTPANIRFIFVDNGSDDNLEAAFRPWLGDKHLYLRNEENLGVYKAFNQGLERVETDIAMWCSTDHLVLHGWFPPILHGITKGGFGWLSPNYPPDGPYSITETYQALAAPEPTQYQVAPIFEGSLGVFDWKRLKAEVGYWDDQFFLVYGDGDYKERLKNAKIPFGVVLEAPSRHLGHQSRRLLDPTADVGMEYKDAAKFAAKWKDRPDILAEYPGLKQTPEEINQLHNYFYDKTDPKQ
jgi:GT2 family glycosyltransferase